jgi:hypothetical protein
MDFGDAIALHSELLKDIRANRSTIRGTGDPQNTRALGELEQLLEQQMEQAAAWTGQLGQWRDANRCCKTESIKRYVPEIMHDVRERSAEQIAPRLMRTSADELTES